MIRSQLSPSALTARLACVRGRTRSRDRQEDICRVFAPARRQRRRLGGQRRTVAAQIGQMGAIQSVAPSLGVELRPVEARDAGEIERAVTAFARSGNGGLIVLSGNASLAHRELIITLAARERLPAVYSDRVFVTGGLVSYDTNRTEQYRRAAGYVDRILKGEKPADLPVQAPTKYELVINLKTAKALGLDVPTTLLARAENVIE